MNKKGITVLSILIMNTIGTFAQKQVVNQNHNWLMYVGNHKLNDKWELHTLYHFRRSLDDNYAWQQSLLRAGVNYKMDKNILLSAGADWVVSFPYGQQPSKYTNNELTGWQAVMVKQNIGRLNMMHRYRIEERFIQKKAIDAVEGNYVNDGIKYANRFRYWYNLNVPINKPTMQEKTWYLNGWNEVFIDLEPGPVYNLLNQNRIGANVGYQWRKGFNLQAGYMNQLLVKADAHKAEINHTIMLQLQYDLDFSKNTK